MEVTTYILVHLYGSNSGFAGSNTGSPIFTLYSVSFLSNPDALVEVLVSDPPAPAKVDAMRCSSALSPTAMGWNSLSRMDRLVDVRVRCGEGSSSISSLEISEEGPPCTGSSTDSAAPVRMGRYSGSSDAMMGDIIMLLLHRWWRFALEGFNVTALG